VTRTIPGFFIPEQYLLFTFIFHFVHTTAALDVGAAEGCDLLILIFGGFEIAKIKRSQAAPAPTKARRL
jgi:hypothetical protein